MKKKSKQILYIGLDPSRLSFNGDVVHCPFICPIPYHHPGLFPLFAKHKEYEAIVLTSRVAVAYYFDLGGSADKAFYVVGEATAEPLRARGISPFVAKRAVAESVCELLEERGPRSVCYPHAKGSRKVIHRWLDQAKIPYLTFPFYETVTIIPESLPHLEAFDEVVFTSPSSVRAFMTCYGSLPKGLQVQAIGLVTAETLRQTVPHLQDIDFPLVASSH